MKLKDKIRDKLRRWLLSDELHKLNLAEKEFEQAKNLYNDEKDRLNWHLDRAIDSYTASYKLTNDCHKLMNSIIDIGTDIGFHSDDH